MTKHIAKLIKAYCWLIDRPSYMLLTASDERLDARQPRRFTHAWGGLMAISLGWGMLAALLWGWSWSIFKEPSQILFTPVAVTITAFVLWPFRRGVIALAEILGGRNAAGRAIAAALLVAVLTLCLLGLRANHYHNEIPLPGFLAWVRPWGELYRVLILMPLWGGWAMLIAGRFCKPNEAASSPVIAFIRGCGPLAATACIIPPTALTWLYFQFLGVWVISLVAVPLVAAIAGAIVLSRPTGGLKRSTLLAANVLTQLAFVLAYLANR